MRVIRAETGCVAAAAAIVLLVQSPVRPQGSGSSHSRPPRATRPITSEVLFQALKREYENQQDDYSRTFRTAKTDAERQQASETERKRTKSSARRAVELARERSADPTAFDALVWIIMGGLGYSPETADEFEDAFGLLIRDHVTSEKLGPICESARIFSSTSLGAESLLRAALEKNPDREVQGAACLSLAECVWDYAAWAKGLMDPAKSKEIEDGLGADVVARLKASDPEELLVEAAALFELTVARYGDIKPPKADDPDAQRLSLGELANAALFEMRNLVIGNVAPDIEGEDIDGRKFKLSDYRGKVVVLEFWGSW